eukprot:TRINITY_DN65295_c0_g2_i1.p1 TRINITY_DN65295_c0_g2~~TRINITY_DN65295_c0_g2_i1.p1  ORF type:complete len:197 (+),score=25.85 TRINITY_DN65295_c0_g2_i1:114-704(+)
MGGQACSRFCQRQATSGDALDAAPGYVGEVRSRALAQVIHNPKIPQLIDGSETLSSDEQHSALNGWYLLDMRSPSGIEGYEERVEVVCLSLSAGDKLTCTLEVRTCLHCEETGATVPDAQIFSLSRMAGTWRLRADDVFCRLASQPGEFCIEPGIVYRSFRLDSLASALWVGGLGRPTEAINCLWEKWGVSQDPHA